MMMKGFSKMQMSQDHHFTMTKMQMADLVRSNEEIKMSQDSFSAVLLDMP